jgi:hypothetical protein
MVLVMGAPPWASALAFALKSGGGVCIHDEQRLAAANLVREELGKSLREHAASDEIDHREVPACELPNGECRSWIHQWRNPGGDPASVRKLRL